MSRYAVGNEVPDDDEATNTKTRGAREFGSVVHAEEDGSRVRLEARDGLWPARLAHRLDLRAKKRDGEEKIRNRDPKETQGLAL